MKITRLSFAVLPLVTLPFLFSCNLEPRVNLNPDLSGSLAITGQAMDFAALAFDDMAILGGFDDASALYDDALEQTRQEMEKRDDISGFSAEMTSRSSWSARADFSDLELLLGSTEAGGIIGYSTSGGVSTLTFNFDRESSAQYSKLMPLFDNPAFSLFDPGATGDLDEETYIQDILGFSFGTENIPQIRRASVKMTLSLPGTVTQVSGGRKVSSDTVSFELPMTRMLIPDPPIRWSVSWR